MKIGKFDYMRCSKELPCPVCGRIKWCLIGENGAVICARVAEGSVRKYSYGHLHFIKDPAFKPIIKKSPLNDGKPSSLVFTYYKTLDFSREALKPLANDLAVKPSVLTDMGVGKDKNAQKWAFPMYNEKHELIGLKCRNLSHNKWCCRGSRLGLYLSRSFSPLLPTMICEGESDTAAMLNLGYNVIGRASATTCGLYIQLILGRAPVYIFADKDEDDLGLNAARELADKIRGQVVYNPMYKDVREWIASGQFLNEPFTKWNLTKGQDNEN